MSDIDKPAQSPCVRDCCLGDDLTCLGCFRSLDEIKEWAVADDHRRLLILQNAIQRRQAHQLLDELSVRPFRPANNR
ncbi:MAG TPA: DUF1289 domain-containing protein [Steroidobacteraceae bacterium]